MSKSEVKESMDKANIPSKVRGVFVMWANRWGVYIGDDMWVEYGPLERHHKIQRSTSEMYNNFKNDKNKH